MEADFDYYQEMAVILPIVVGRNADIFQQRVLYWKVRLGHWKICESLASYLRAT